MSYLFPKFIRNIYMCFVSVLQCSVPGCRPRLAALGVCVSLAVFYGLRCGVLTSLSPWCHPASVGLRHHWLLPKSHSATSAIHKRQALLLSFHIPLPPPPLKHICLFLFSQLNDT